MHRSTRAVALGAILALALAAPVSAASVPESFTVNSTLSISGLPASIDYGNLDAGATSATFPVDATISANVKWNFYVSGSDFSGTGFPKSIREGKMTILSGAATLASGTLAGWLNFADPKYSGSFVDALTNATSGTSVIRTELRITVPADAMPGAHTGSVTFVCGAQ